MASAPPLPPLESAALSSIFAGLRSKSVEEREHAADEIRNYLVSAAPELSAEAYSRLNNDINKRIFELLRTGDVYTRIGGIMALERLINTETAEENPVKVTRFANYLRSVIPSADTEVMRAGIGAMGKLTAPGGLAADLVEFEVKRALEWLQSDRQELRRHAAVLMIRSIAINSPTLLYSYMNQIVDLIWIGLRDPKQIIRLDSAETLKACLDIIYERDSSLRQQWYVKILEETQNGLRSAGGGVVSIGNVSGGVGTSGPAISGGSGGIGITGGGSAADIIHGSLLAYRELLRNAGMFMQPRYTEVCDTVLRYRDHKDALVRRTVLMILPDLAKYNPADFTKTYLADAMVHLIGQFKKERDRAVVFISIGQIALSVRSNISYYLDPILDNIRDGLGPKSGNRYRREQEAAIFECIGMLSSAVGQALAKHLTRDVFDLIFSCGLSRSLNDCITELVVNIPPLQTVVRDRLLNMLSYTLSGSPFRPPGSPSATIQSHSSVPRSGVHDTNGSAHNHTLTTRDTFNNSVAAHEYREAMLARDGLASEMSEDALITLALNMIGSFDFKGQSLSEFVRNCVIHYIEHPNPSVRKSAALTSCSLYLHDPICFQVSANSLRAVSQVVERLLSVAVTDVTPEIRIEVLQSLDKDFDPHLSQADNVRLLFMALNDEVFRVRQIAMAIIGRLTAINPAYVVPSLRKTLIQLLTELQHSGNAKKKEESAKLLSLLISSTAGLVRPYLKPVLKVLLPRARDNPHTVAASVITAIGELSTVGRESMLVYVPQLMPLIIETLQEQSSAVKRDATLRTLGQFSSSSGYVIDPLLQYPQLLGILVNILKTEQSITIRRETVRLMGILGALDPYKHREVERRNENTTSSTNSDSNGDRKVTDDQMRVSDRDIVELDQQRAPDRVSPNTSSPDSSPEHSTPIDILLLMQGMSPTADEYYPTVVITTLMGILKDPSLVTHHTMTAQAILFIFKSLGLKCVPFLHQIVPGMIAVIRSSAPPLAEFFFRQLCVLVGIVKQHTRIYLSSIFAAIEDYFRVTSMQPTILNLIDTIAHALEGEFKAYIPRLLPMLIGVLSEDVSSSRDASIKVLNTFIGFGPNIEEYVHLIVPNVVNLFEEDTAIPLRIAAIETIGDLCRTVNLNDMASRIIHPLLRTLNSGSEELRKAAMDTLSSLCYQMGSDFTVFIPVINDVLVRNKIHSSTYEQLVAKLLSSEPLPQNLNPQHRKRMKADEDAAPADAPSKKLPVNQQHLKNSWDVSQRSTRDDWHEWIRRLSVEFLKESPSHALRACAGIAAVYVPIARDLFNASFYSCWSELYDAYKDDLVRAFETALVSPNIPPEVLQTLLNLAEYMEHDEKPLPMDIRTLAQYAQKCHAYAKALHYKELEFMQEPTTPTIEALISINNQLQQSDAAIGILKHAQQHAQQHHDLQLKETWYEKLQRWDDALEAYNRREKEEPDSMEITMGKMRCLHALGEWELLSQLAREKWTSSSNSIRRAVAPLAAAAAWGLGQWEKMDSYIAVMKPESPDRSFFNAVFCIHRRNFEEAERQILKARDLLVTELTALVSESYNRAYGVVVRVQMLAELEEIIAYKRLPDSSEIRETMRRTWMKRLNGCQRNVDIWQRMLKVRALVVSPKQDMDMWIKFANLCRKSGRLGLAEKSLNALLADGAQNGTDGTEINGGDASQLSPSWAPPKVVYAQLKFMWAAGNHQEALDHLIEFTARMCHDLNLNKDDLISQSLPSERPGAPNEIKEYTQLLARCFLKQGEWQVALRPSWKVEDPETILGSYLLATHFDKSWYKAWHNWALANFEVISSESGAEDDDEGNHSDSGLPMEFTGPALATATDAEITTGPSPPLVTQHVVPALQGFFHSIALSEQKSLQDTLRLLTLWFKYGGLPEPAAAISEGFSMIRLEVWLEVVPQLISRIHQPNPVVSKALDGLLSELGRTHPQALVYPLTVAIKSDSLSRQKAASTILDKMRSHSAILVEQADLVSFELIRVAVLWHEQWHEGLEDASRFFFGDHNIEKMFATLEPLHRSLERVSNEFLNNLKSYTNIQGPETLREVSFQTAFGHDLHEAHKWVVSFKKTNDLAHLNQAWDFYYNVFRRITRQLPQLQSLDLQYVSPKLLAARDLQLAVPGTYLPGKPVISISRFEPIFSVISSKQRPRRLTVKGNDGKDYQYALKGHEDIRQDNLVMQLFGLVNTLLADDPECFKRHLNIQQYPAIPLSPKSGLLGWVPNSDTFHVLIREYREGKLLLNIEHRIMLQMAPDYENLTHLQKIEVFTYALDNTRGQDLYRVLWLKSKSSESWLDRRTQYTRSLAVMSMVGYILGLGDRHPSNLMLNRYTGKVVHIDFGDCFEAAILREKFPEKVPFRLTRMLTYAMEVSGIEGSFRITCEHVMSLLRQNKESLMAILEAFAYDPLINWGFDIPIKLEQTADRNLDRWVNSESDETANNTVTNGTTSTVTETVGNGPENEAVLIEQQHKTDVRNARASIVLKRITDKLTGNDFKRFRDLDVPTQVDKLIQQATNIENLCQHYIGWCSFW